MVKKAFSNYVIVKGKNTVTVGIYEQHRVISGEEAILVFTPAAAPFANVEEAMDHIWQLSGRELPRQDRGFHMFNETPGKMDCFSCGLERDHAIHSQQKEAL